LGISSGVISFLAAAASLVMAVLLYFRKRGDRIAIYVSYFLLGYSFIMAGPMEMWEFLFFGETGRISVRAQWIFAIPTLILLATFPTGKTEPALIRWVIPAAFLSLPFMLFFSSTELISLSTPRALLLGVYLGLLTLSALIGQVYRYKQISSQVQRQQTKLVLFGIGIWAAFLGFSAIPYYLVKNNPDSVQLNWQYLFTNIWWLGLLILPVSLILAVIRSHLWDIDVIIRRTLVYSLLTAVSTAIYFASVLVFQSIFRSTNIPQSQAGLVISTLIIAALFNPLRSRINSMIARRI